MEQYITRSLIGRKKRFEDWRNLILNVYVNAKSREEIDELFEYVNETLIQPFRERFVLDISTETKRTLSAKRVKEIFYKEMDNGDAAVLYDAILKNDFIKMKKDYNEWRRLGSEMCGLGFDYMEDEDEEAFEKKRWDRQRSIILESGSKEKAVERLLNMEGDTEDHINEVNFHDDASFMFTCSKLVYEKNMYQGKIDFEAKLYCLQDNIEAAAVELISVMERICEITPMSTGFITVGINPQFASPSMNYFTRIKSGDVEVNGEKYDVFEWLKLKYTEGLEWANILAPQVADKIASLDDIKKSSDFKITRRDDGGVSIYVNSPIMKYKASVYAPYYRELAGCLRPGYDEEKIEFLNFGKENIYIPPEEYVIDGDTVYFKRGNFNFINVPFDSSKLFST